MLKVIKIVFKHIRIVIKGFNTYAQQNKLTILSKSELQKVMLSFKRESSHQNYLFNL